MAMRVCVYCKQDVTYERENRNILKGGAVGFWTNPITGQATCPAAPVDPKSGQQLHSVGDVHTPPVNDPEQLEAFLNGTYVPPAPPMPCGNLYGMNEEGEFLECGLEKDHEGACAPGTPVQASAGDSPDVGTGMVMMDVQEEDDNDTITISAAGDGMSIKLTFQKSKVGPAEVSQLLSVFPAEAHKVLLSILTGVDPSIIEAAREAQEAASKPEPPKILEDPEDIEKFLNGDE